MSGDIGRSAAVLAAILLVVFGPMATASERMARSRAYAIADALDSFTACIKRDEALTAGAYGELQAALARTGAVCSADMYIARRYSEDAADPLPDDEDEGFAYWEYVFTYEEPDAEAGRERDADPAMQDYAGIVPCAELLDMLDTAGVVPMYGGDAFSIRITVDEDRTGTGLFLGNIGKKTFTSGVVIP